MRMKRKALSTLFCFALAFALFSAMSAFAETTTKMPRVIKVMGPNWQSRLAGFVLLIFSLLWHFKGLSKKKLAIPEA